MPLGLAAGIITSKISVVSVPEAHGCRRSFGSKNLPPAMGAVNWGSNAGQSWASGSWAPALYGEHVVEAGSR
jgi:hypothetical protein